MGYRQIIFYISLIFLILTSSTLMAEDDVETFKVKGYFKTYTTISDVSGFMAMKSEQTIDEEDKYNKYLIGTILNIVKLDLKWLPSEIFSFNAAYELNLPIQAAFAQRMSSSKDAIEIPYVDPMLILPTFRPFQRTEADIRNYRIFDLRHKMHNFDRAVITISPSFGDIYIGRQAITFGSAHVISPVDILLPASKTSLSTEERSGVDAIRIRIPTGNMSELDMGFVGGEGLDWSNNAAFFRSRLYFLDTDIILTVMDFRENLLLGLELARSIGGAGFWFETAYTYAGAFSVSNHKEDYLRLSTGLDYKLLNSVYAFMEYHHNGAGKSNPKDYVDFINKGKDEDKFYNVTAYELGGVYLLGQHYIIPGITLELTTLIGSSIQCFINLNDISMLFAPTLSYSISENIMLGAGAFINSGSYSKTEIKTDKNKKISELNIETNSEFNLYPDTYFISFMIYF